jgi:hypothetical protein
VSLFDEPGFEIVKLRAPLAERLRPKMLDGVVEHLTGESPTRSLM